MSTVEPASSPASPRKAPRWSVVGMVTPEMLVLPPSMAGLPCMQRDGQCRPAVIGQRAEARVGDVDLVAIGPGGQSAGAPGADQVVRARRRHRAAAERDIAGRARAAARCSSATIVLSRVAVPPAASRPPPVPTLATVLLAMVTLTAVSVPVLSTPPPAVAASSSAMVEFVIVSVAAFAMPPPSPAEL